MIDDDDRGYLYGDALFETLRVSADGVLYNAEAHRARMMRSARALGFDVGRVDEAFKTLRRRAQGLAASKGEGLLRVTLSRRGEGAPFGGLGSCRIRWRALPSIQRGAPYTLCFVERAFFPKDMLAEHKTGNYLRAIQVRREAMARGFDDGIRVSTDSLISETSTGNIFLWRDGEVWTPPIEGLLPGVIRARVIDHLRQAGVMVHDASHIHRGVLTLASTTEVWVSSTGFGLRAATSLEGRALTSEHLDALIEGARLWERS